MFGSKTNSTWKIPQRAIHIFALTYHPSLTSQILLLIYIYKKVLKSPLFFIHQEQNILLILAHPNPLTSFWQMAPVTLNLLAIQQNSLVSGKQTSEFLTSQVPPPPTPTDPSSYTLT